MTIKQTVSLAFGAVPLAFSPLVAAQADRKSETQALAREGRLNERGETPAAAGAAGDPRAAAEIQALVDLLPASGCAFERNGHWHSGTDARVHLLRKDASLRQRRPSRTADDFVAHAASASSSTGRPYSVRCAGRTMAASAWFADRLQHLRSLADRTSDRP